MSDDQLRAMLRDLGRALSDAIGESPEIRRNLQKIRQEGYSLQLLLDCKKEEERKKEGERKAETARLAAPKPERRDTACFRINATDLSFLRSIGIDPTRRLRRKRSS